MAEDSSQEKTETPSEKKRRDARQEGTVAKSTEVNSVFVLLAAIFLLRLIGPWMLSELEQNIRETFAMISETDMSDQRLILLAQSSLMLLIKLIIPFVSAIMFAGLIANIIQVGLMATVKPITPKLEKVNPLSGFKRMFAMRSIVETIKNILKISIIGYIAYLTIRGDYSILIALADASVEAIWNFIFASAYDIFLRTALALLVIAVADYSYQRYEHEKKLKMSHQEVKEERKQMDGDPQIKARIRSLQREMARRRMMDSVPQASVVVTNPTHLAIALLYEPEKDMDAPVVTAKGKGVIAQRIKKLAEDNKVPVVEDKPLAWAMFDKVEVNQPIPEEFFMAVAEILAYVYRMNNKGAA
ncbi:MAG: flagellar biosynthesis protein FlhB [Chitinispirillales bacterium]|jgi:flagellar biosynthetic protein FlhB|nr:flagellar biosynthesis protein FlhB [Chitinispirillales bacterium]